MGHVQVSRLVPSPPRALFNFLVNPENVPETVAGSLRIEFARTPPVLAPGMEVEAVVTRYGIAVRAIFRIETWEDGHRLSYRQVAGFLRSWEHSLQVDEHDAHTSRLTEVISFRMPLGLIGSLLDDVFVRRDVERGLMMRQNRIASLFAGAEAMAQDVWHA